MGMASISHVTADRAKSIEKLVLADGTTSQWLHAAPYETCFCIAVRSEHASWKIEGQLPDNEIVTLSHYRKTSGVRRKTLHIRFPVLVQLHYYPDPPLKTERRKNMKGIIVQYTVKEEFVETNKANIQQVMVALSTVERTSVTPCIPC